MLFDNTPERAAVRFDLAASLRHENNLIGPVVRGFLGDLYVVHMRFTHACGSNFYEFRFLVQIFDGAAATIAHGSTQAADQLINDGNNTAFVRDASLNAFRYELVDVIGRVLEVAVGRTIGHRAKAAHAAIRLVRTSLEKHNLTRRFFGTRKHAAHHAG